MVIQELSLLVVQQRAIASNYLNRFVIFDCYIPKNTAHAEELSLLLINDGQDLDEMNFAAMYNDLLLQNVLHPVVCVGIHANKDRKNEYGTAQQKDYAGRGARAAAFTNFILYELLPFVSTQFGVKQFKRTGYAGFSLGGLSALDITWNHADVFQTVGVFSGSLWWRSKPLGDDYSDDTDRIMHQQLRRGPYNGGLRFFFTTGSLDETADRNYNGIIDSIDDTLDLIKELKKLGYTDSHIEYINYADGKHDVGTWGRAMPGFLLWGWGKDSKERTNFSK